MLKNKNKSMIYVRMHLIMKSRHVSTVYDEIMTSFLSQSESNIIHNPKMYELYGEKKI